MMTITSNSVSRTGEEAIQFARLSMAMRRMGRALMMEPGGAFRAAQRTVPVDLARARARFADRAASSAPLDALAGISGVGAKKLEAYGEEILRVLG